MNRRRFLGVAGALGAAAATGACGIPGRSEPRFLESGRPVEPQRDAPADPPGPSAASTPDVLVANYLKAAAGANYAGGDKPDALARAQERVRAYLTRQAQQDWQLDKKLTVVRAAIGTPTQAGSGAFDVNVGLTVIGELTGQGAIEPSANVIKPFPIRVVSAGSGYLLDGPMPPFMLLSDDGLKDYYSPQVIYFWDATDKRPMLVPDQRYLLKSIGRSNQPTEIVNWLGAGAPPWLAPALGGQPLDGIEVKDVALNDQQQLMVNLSAKAANIDKHLLAVQLRWSTGAIGGVDVRIEGASTGVSSDDYLNFNALATRPDNNGEPERFCVANRKVQPVEPRNSTAILDSETNAEVLAAAIPISKRTAALVRQEPYQGKPGCRLWIGTLSGSGDTSTPSYTRTGLWKSSMSRPVWISRPSPQVLVVADGNLYSAPVPPPGHTGDIPVAGPLQPASFPGPLTALSVSPDGRRIAFIAGGKVVIAPLKLDDPVTVGETFRTIQTDLPVQRAVAWSGETKLLVGGAPIKDTKTVALFEITINGAGQEPVPPEGTGNYTIDVLSVRPASPTGSPQLAMLDANGTAYRVYAAEIQPLKLGGPSPAPSPSTAPSEVRLTAPFFLD